MWVIKNLKQMKTELCKCNNCDRLLIDENPQVDAQKIEVGNVRVHSMEWIDEGENSFWACPYCLTDAYLTDIINLEN
jgi:hypothetical protein